MKENHLKKIWVTEWQELWEDTFKFYTIGIYCLLKLIILKKKEEIAGKKRLK